MSDAAGEEGDGGEQEQGLFDDTLQVAQLLHILCVYCPVGLIWALGYKNACYTPLWKFCGEWGDRNWDPHNSLTDPIKGGGGDWELQQTANHFDMPQNHFGVTVVELSLTRERRIWTRVSIEENQKAPGRENKIEAGIATVN